MKHGVVEESKKEELLTPMGLSATLNTMPCTFAFDREDRISVIHLIAQVGSKDHPQVKTFFVNIGVVDRYFFRRVLGAQTNTGSDSSHSRYSIIFFFFFVRPENIAKRYETRSCCS